MQQLTNGLRALGLLQSESEVVQTPSQLLALPADIRHRIYSHLELPYNHIIRLTVVQRKQRKLNNDTPYTTGVYSLLLTCRLLYSEIRDIVYSNNHFTATASEYGDLDLLREIRPASIAKLTKLTVEPRTRCCPQAWQCRGRNEIDPMSPRAQFYDSGSEPYMITEKKILLEWLKLWHDHLESNLTPGRTHMHFIFDASSTIMARAASKAFWEGQQGMFKTLTIRLSDTPDQHIRRVATLAVNRASQTQPYGGSIAGFRFMDLPIELREEILKHTDLVTPKRAVWWTPKKGMRPVLYSSAEDYSFDHDDDSSTVAVAPGKDEPPSCTERTWPIGCFCASAHSAYTSNIEYKCTCWSPPTALLLVSRTMRAEAMRVFYNNNELRLLPQAGRYMTFEFTENDLPATIYLQFRAPQDGLQHLRKLDIVFPPWLPSYPGTSFHKTTHTWARWNACVQNLKTRSLFHNLTLRVVFAPAYDDDNIHNEPESILTKYKEQITLTDGLYYDALSPLTDLPGLECLIVELPCFRTDYQRVVEAEEALARKIMNERYAPPPPTLLRRSR